MTTHFLQSRLESCITAFVVADDVNEQGRRVARSSLRRIGGVEDVRQRLRCEVLPLSAEIRMNVMYLDSVILVANENHHLTADVYPHGMILGGGEHPAE